METVEMVNIEISIPKEMLLLMQSGKQPDTLEQSALLLYPYIRNLTISHGRAAEILGIRKRDLIELFDQMGLPYLNQTPQELESELRAWHRLREGTA